MIESKPQYSMKNSLGHAITVVAVIHQPSSQLFRQLQDLLILVDGRTAFQGGASEIIDYSESIGRKIPQFTNPVEHFMENVHVSSENPDESRTGIESICLAWNRSEYAKKVLLRVVDTSDSKKIKLETFVQPKLSQSRQLAVLLMREVIERRRNRFLLLTMLLRTATFNLFYGSMYFKLGNRMDQGAVQSVNGCLFFLMVNQALANIIPVIQTFTQELHVFHRENFADICDVVPYYVSKYLANLPVDLFLGVAFTPIAFYMVGFNENSEVFGGFVGIQALMTLVATGLGYLISCVAPNINVALVLVAIVVVFPLVPSGLLVGFSRVPIWYVWLRESSPFTWTFRLLMTNQWKNYGKIECSEIDRSEGKCTETLRQFVDGESVLNFYQIKPDVDASNGPVVLICLVLAYHASALTVLALKARRQRPRPAK